MDLQDQQQLVTEAQQSTEGFGRLYDHYFPRVYSFVASKVSDRDDAEDLTSEIFMKILENIHSFEWRGVPFAAWIFRIARNTLNTYYARHAKKKTTDIEEVYGLAEDEEKTSPHVKAVKNELAEKVKEVMKELPVRELTVVQLKFFSQLNNREIMHVTGLSESNVAIILFRTLKKIKPDLTYFA
jgi:RNA polymerase sigma-70 factor (ECF subfamily)